MLVQDNGILRTPLIDRNGLLGISKGALVILQCQLRSRPAKHCNQIY
jgi:hypothetical protein